MMRNTLFRLVLVALVALMTSVLPWSPVTAGDDLENTTLTIKGMTCGGCVAAVKLRLSKIEGVTDYEVSLKKGEAEVAYDPTLTNPEAIADAVSETGFKAKVK